ncbi:hypothetical protein HYW42_03340 [Candidatus Daviesbacteria bacterium]|nr:hypothetical protein [Candidatus Daviesbacteria bacterium]
MSEQDSMNSRQKSVFDHPVVKEAMAKNEQVQREWKEKIREAREKAPPDKEPFNLKSFAEMYDPSLINENGEPVNPDEGEIVYEADYYIRNPQIKTMKDFVEHRRIMDSHDAT